MKEILKKAILPGCLLIAGLAAGRWTAPDNSKDMEKKFEAERKVFFDRIGQKEAEIQAIDKAAEARTARWEKDSIQLSDALQVQKRATRALRKENEKINYNTADNPAMDSIDLILFGSR